MKFGILGDAKISRNRLIPALHQAGCKFVHLGTRNPQTLTDGYYDKSIKIGQYEDVLADTDVEAVYIPLPNHLHAQWSINALNAGKHVLCEKPMALSLSEIEAVEAAAMTNNRYFYEAFMVRSHPQWSWLKQLDIGTAMHISATFSYPPRAKGNVRNYAYMGGGPVLDIAGYTLLAGMMIFESEPHLLFCDMQMEPHLDVEKTMNALLDFGAGRRLSMQVSSAMALSQTIHLTSENGWARLDTPFNPEQIATASWALGELGEGKKRVFEPCNQYALMLNAFITSCQNQTKPDFTISKQICALLQEILTTRT